MKNSVRFLFFLIIIIFLGCMETSLALIAAYASFEEPKGWECEMNEGVWVCQSKSGPEKKESVILSLATVATEWDSVDNYIEYLKQKRKIVGPNGKLIESKITYTRKHTINGYEWADSLQYNSELPHFWARYLATVHNKIAILITYIVSDAFYKKLAGQFDILSNTLKINEEFNAPVSQKQGNEGDGGDAALPDMAKLGPIQKSILANRLNLQENGGREVGAKEDEASGALENNPGKQTKALLILLLFLIAVGVVVVLYIKKRQNPPQ